MAEQQQMYVDMANSIEEAWRLVAPTRKHEGCIVLIPVPPRSLRRDQWTDVVAGLSEHRLVQEAVYGSPMRSVMTPAERSKFGGYDTGLVIRCKPFDAVEVTDG